MTTERTVFRTCPLCEATCGLEIRVEGDEVTRIRGDKDDVLSGGFICPKGSTLGKLHVDPDRLRMPLVRKDGEHVEVSWEEAFEAVQAGFDSVVDAHGRGAVAAYLGNPNVHNMAGSLFVRPMLSALETRNLYTASTVDQRPREVSAAMMFGGAIPVPDLDRTDWLLMLGANPLESNGSLCTAGDFPGRLRAIRERGGKIVVVDPRRTRTAKQADEHLFVRPGSDALLLVAMAQVLFDEDLVAPGRVGDFTNGLAEVGERIAPFTPERVAGHTGIAADEIRRLARELATAEHAVVYGRMGVHTVEFGTLASWATDLLTLLTGNLDREGGGMFSRPAHGPLVSADAEPIPGRVFQTGRWRSRVRDLPEISSELPVAALAEEIDTPGEGRLRFLLTVAGNPVLSTPNGERLDKACEALDFMVSVDPYLNETTRHADVILPPPSILERSHYDLAFYAISVRNVANYSAPVFETSAPSEAEIHSRLSGIFGGKGTGVSADDVANQIVRASLRRVTGGDDARAAELEKELEHRPPTERILDVLLRTGAYGDAFGGQPDGLSLERLEAAPHGIDLGPLEPALPGSLRTPTGKIEAAPQVILDDLARLEQKLDVEPAKGLVLVGRRMLRSNNSWMHNIDVLVRGREQCTLQVHPDDARELGLGEGDLARIASRVGEVEAPVELCDDILRGVVSLPHGFGHDRPGTRLRVAAANAGVNSNRLTDELPLDPLSGNAVLNGIPVRVAAI